MRPLNMNGKPAMTPPMFNPAFNSIAMAGPDIIDPIVSRQAMQLKSITLSSSAKPASKLRNKILEVQPK